MSPAIVFPVHWAVTVTMVTEKTVTTVNSAEETPPVMTVIPGLVIMQIMKIAITDNTAMHWHPALPIRWVAAATMPTEKIVTTVNTAEGIVPAIPDSQVAAGAAVTLTTVIASTESSAAAMVFAQVLIPPQALLAAARITKTASTEKTVLPQVFAVLLP